MEKLALSVVLGVLLGTTSLAAAQDVDQARMELARAEYNAGSAAYEEGRFEEALQHFREAHRLTDNPDILYNVATVADRLRQDGLALDAYRGYLDARPNAEDRTQVEARISVLTEQIAAREREEEARAAAEREAAAQAAAEREAAERELAEREAREQALREQLREASSEGPGVAPWIVAIGGGVAAITGGIFVGLAAADQACVSDPSGCVQDPENPTWAEVSAGHERAPTYQVVGWTLIGVGAAAAAAGVIWMIVASPDAESEEVSAHLTPMGMQLRGRF